MMAPKIEDFISVIRSQNNNAFSNLRSLRDCVFLRIEDLPLSPPEERNRSKMSPFLTPKLKLKDDIRQPPIPSIS